ncbi:glycosyltransferase family 2 protein [Phaeobacter marinintestinus]|uniref:glycosyltransferase family 2 protein n=1 Tax=Falsiphaeobacter marinintestinus TaxID=1492905 RepID=UPI00164820B8|nr:glycosyltransferase family 2 protein [Phaeobacter marinintestinus]
MRDIARFAAYHLDLGAAEVHIFLDEPSDAVDAFFEAYPKVYITQCNAAYWRGVPDAKRSTHQRRQAYNASRCYRECALDWLAHIDVDEFLLSSRPLVHALGAVPQNVTHARMRPAELLAQSDAFRGPAHFKLPRPDWDDGKAALVDIYPEFGAYLTEGFLGYVGGKIVARTGVSDLHFGIHALKQGGQVLGGGLDLADVHVGHAHAPSFEAFERHLEFRMTKGSYRRKPNDSMKVEDIVKVIRDTEGRAGLRRFYDQINLATPHLLDRLAAHDMLLTATLDLDEKVTRWFGPMPEDA